MFKDRRLLAIFRKIIDSYTAHPQRGMPIGNLTSQYFANHYLAVLDHFIKEKLGIHAYVRYMDDMVLWHTDKRVLQNVYTKICQLVNRQLLCDLKPELLNQSSCGLPFLGYTIFPHQVRLTRQSKRRFIRKVTIVEDGYHSGAWDETTCQRRMLPLLAFASHANTKNLRERLFYR